ncbi:Protein phosphatase inhibitor 2 [Balamuthia mandrillaris]
MDGDDDKTRNEESQSVQTVNISGSPSHQSSAKKQKQVHGILKNAPGHNPSDKKTSTGVAWDEDNLIFNEANKSATMKIEEPPTPYNRDYDSTDDYSSPSEGEAITHSKQEKQTIDTDGTMNEQAASGLRFVEEEEAMQQGYPPSRSVQPKSPRSIKNHARVLTSALEEVERRNEKAKKKKKRVKVTVPSHFSEPSDSDNEEEDDSKKAEFAKKRAAHYNEWRALQEFKKSHTPEEKKEKKK